MLVADHRRRATLSRGDLVALLGDDCGDLAATQQSARDTAGVGAIGDHCVGSHTGHSAARHDDLIEDTGQHRLIVALTASHDHRQWAPVAVDGGVDLGGQPAP